MAFREPAELISQSIIRLSINGQRRNARLDAWIYGL